MEPRRTERKPSLKRALVLGIISTAFGLLGMMLARPIATHFLHFSPWVLPAIAVGVLTVLVVGALLVLPRLAAPRP